MFPVKFYVDEMFTDEKDDEPARFKGQYAFVSF